MHARPRVPAAVDDLDHGILHRGARVARPHRVPARRIERPRDRRRRWRRPTSAGCPASRSSRRCASPPSGRRTSAGRSSDSAPNASRSSDAHRVEVHAVARRRDDVGVATAGTDRTSEAVRQVDQTRRPRPRSAHPPSTPARRQARRRRSAHRADAGAAPARGRSSRGHRRTGPHRPSPAPAPPRGDTPRPTPVVSPRGPSRDVGGTTHRPGTTRREDRRDRVAPP